MSERTRLIEEIREACLQSALTCARSLDARNTQDFLHAYNTLDPRPFGRPTGLDSGRAIREETFLEEIISDSVVATVQQGKACPKSVMVSVIDFEGIRERHRAKVWGKGGQRWILLMTGGGEVAVCEDAHQTQGGMTFTSYTPG